MISTILHFVALFFIVVVIILNSKFRFFFSYNFFNKIFANVLFFVRAVHFAWAASRFLFPTTIASSLFSGNAFKKHVNKQKICIGRCPANVSISPDLKTLISFLSTQMLFLECLLYTANYFQKM